VARPNAADGISFAAVINHSTRYDDRILAVPLKEPDPPRSLDELERNFIAVSNASSPAITSRKGTCFACLVWATRKKRGRWFSGQWLNDFFLSDSLSSSIRHSERARFGLSDGIDRQ